jgi:hypothetical protein
MTSNWPSIKIFIGSKQPPYCEKGGPMSDDTRELDDFDHALQAEALSPQIQNSKQLKDDDFYINDHNECIYHVVTGFLDRIVTAPQQFLSSLINDEGFSDVERRYLESLGQIISKESRVLFRITTKALSIASKLESEHLDRVQHVADDNVAQCYPITYWNLEKYLWWLVYRLIWQERGHLGTKKGGANTNV